MNEEEDFNREDLSKAFVESISETALILGKALTGVYSKNFESLQSASKVISKVALNLAEILSMNKIYIQNKDDEE